MPADLPVELHRKIYAMACMDDGSTGRALSLVSHSVREVSAEFRWQSIAVAGRRPLHYLLQTLSALPDDKRTVLHLCISDMEPPVLRRVGPPPSGMYIGDVDISVLGYAPLRRVRRTQGELEEEWKDEAIARTGHSIMVLLELVAPTLRTLSMVLFEKDTVQPVSVIGHFFSSVVLDAGYNQRELDLGKLALPHLRELTLRGEARLPLSSTLAPSLRRLHLADECLPVDLEQHLAEQHPLLTHLRVSRILKTLEHLTTLLRLPVVLGVIPASAAELTEEPDMNLVPLKEGTCFFLVEPGPTRFWGSGGRGRNKTPGWRDYTPPGYYEMFEHFERLNGTFPPFILLPEHRAYAKGREAEVARNQWLERIEGQPGCWQLQEKKLTSRHALEVAFAAFMNL